jgi:hypothetical protein
LRDGVQTSGGILRTGGGIRHSSAGRGRAELGDYGIVTCAGMPARNIVYLLIAWMAVSDAVGAAEAVKEDPAVPAAERPAEAKPAPAATPAPKEKPPGAPLFERPPVPEFMLKKPAKPLTLEEMQKQADEAAARTRRAREAREAASPAQDPKTDSTGARPEPPRM